MPRFGFGDVQSAFGEAGQKQFIEFGKDEKHALLLGFGVELGEISRFLWIQIVRFIAGVFDYGFDGDFITYLKTFCYKLIIQQNVPAKIIAVFIFFNIPRVNSF